MRFKRIVEEQQTEKEQITKWRSLAHHKYPPTSYKWRERSVFKPGDQEKPIHFSETSSSHVQEDAQEAPFLESIPAFQDSRMNNSDIQTTEYPSFTQQSSIHHSSLQTEQRHNSGFLPGEARENMQNELRKQKNTSPIVVQKKVRKAARNRKSILPILMREKVQNEPRRKRGISPMLKEAHGKSKQPVHRFPVRTLISAVVTTLISVCMVIYLLSRFSHELETIEYEMIRRNNLLERAMKKDMHHSHTRWQHKGPEHHRKLFTLQSDKEFGHGNTRSGSLNPFQRARKTITILRELTEVLSSPNYYAFTANVHGVAQQLVSRKSTVQRERKQHYISGNGWANYQHQPPKYALHKDFLNGRSRDPSPVSKEYFGVVKPGASQFTSGIQNRQHSLNQIHRGNLGATTQSIHGLGQNAAKTGELLKTSSQNNMIGNRGMPYGSPTQQNRLSRRFESPSGPVQSRSPPSNSSQFGSASIAPCLKPSTINVTQQLLVNSSRTNSSSDVALSDHTESRVDAIELWELPDGKWLCRIYNVGRKSDGRLFMPSWMSKYSFLLQHRCGVKDARFSLKLEPTSNRYTIDANVTNKKIDMALHVDAADINYDLVGKIAPRHHMPHFVSDILMPMLVVEVMMSPNHDTFPFSHILPSSPTTIPSRGGTAFRSLNPAMLMRQETTASPPMNWVPRVAAFFRHPKIGFKLLPVPESGAGNNRTALEKVRLFRSLLTINVAYYTPQILFDSKGKSHLLTQNGVAREQAWAVPCIKETPCRVSVTALTRNGSRALLQLDDLEKRIRTQAHSKGIHIDFKVVEFETLLFDEQVRTMQETNVLIATHGAGNANLLFMRPAAAVIEVFPFAYKAGPFDNFARLFGLDYHTAMSAPQTELFKECMDRHETKNDIKKQVFEWWDKAVEEEKKSPWVHRLELEKEFGREGLSEGMTTRRCVRMQQLKFNIDDVSKMSIESALRQCEAYRAMRKSSLK